MQLGLAETDLLGKRAGNFSTNQPFRAELIGDRGRTGIHTSLDVVDSNRTREGIAGEEDAGIEAVSETRRELLLKDRIEPVVRPARTELILGISGWDFHIQRNSEGGPARLVVLCVEAILRLEIEIAEAEGVCGARSVRVVDSEEWEVDANFQSAEQAVGGLNAGRVLAQGGIGEGLEAIILTDDFQVEMVLSGGIGVVRKEGLLGVGDCAEGEGQQQRPLHLESRGSVS